MLVMCFAGATTGERRSNFDGCQRVADDLCDPRFGKRISVCVI